MVDTNQLFSRSEMGRASNRSLAYLEKDTAERFYDEVLEKFTPDLLVQNGGPSEEIAQERAKGLASNAHYLEENGRNSFDILIPEQEYGWTDDVIEPLAENNNSHVYLSEKMLGRNLKTALDDVQAAHEITNESDEIFYHTSSAHARALETAANETHQGEREYKVFGFGSDPFLEHLKHGVFNKAYQKFTASKRRSI